jgi:hypothetical protein
MQGALPPPGYLLGQSIQFSQGAIQGKVARSARLAAEPQRFLQVRPLQSA